MLLLLVVPRNLLTDDVQVRDYNEGGPVGYDAYSIEAQLHLLLPLVSIDRMLSMSVVPHSVPSP